ncbi:hypothetical protein JMJ55_20530 [Belnapia sp. T6]|uniref:PsiF repeat-containing protein n=1 Tax=Belnapia mucosa TaxID=2804532 RepID=A0ABS1V7T3_9PROT|nr:PsiF family protein [Belnapia mucosa]MBL6457727.1 hypothetical protein [Belnapia mucosa]
MRWLALAPSLALSLSFALPATAAERREPSPAQRAQQEKMRNCATQARGQQLHGQPRRDFMKTCLSGRATG